MLPFSVVWQAKELIKAVSIVHKQSAPTQHTHVVKIGAKIPMNDM